MKSRR